MNFTLRQLEYVVAIARHGSFSAAARASHVSQPALSMQVAQLETALGNQLFERTSKRVNVTPFGIRFVEKATALLANVSELEAVAQSSREPLVGDLRLGVIPTVAPYSIPRIATAIRERHPRCRLLLTEHTTPELVARAENGNLDVILLALEADLHELTTHALFADPFVVACAADHPLAARKKIALEELNAAQLLLLEDGHCLSDQVRQYCGAAGDNVIGDFRAGSLQTLMQMVALGYGVTLLPTMARAAFEAMTPPIVTRPLAAPAKRTIGLAWRRSHPREREFVLLAKTLRGPSP
jgi:LysR family transcriptional regulator, hydrogen peroxide-inducible genes activator